MYKLKIVWRNVFLMSILHGLALNAIYLGFKGNINWGLVFYFYFLIIFGFCGIQFGAHRFWSHKCFKAKLPLRVLLMIAQTFALQNDIIEWCRDHRSHHKYSDTDADPHNSNRGFFFSHMGWLLCKKHPDLKEKGKNLDLSDLYADPVVMFQHKYYIPLLFLIWGLFPTASVMYFFGQSLMTAISFNSLRYVISLHFTWTVNSLAHLYGTKPYDKEINPRNNFFVIIWTFGEGYHNYHHVFPYDYSASEFGWKTCWNPITTLIDFFAWIGWAYDLKVAPSNIIENRIKRTGDKEKHKSFKNLNYVMEYSKALLLLLFPIIVHKIFKFLTQIPINNVS